MWMNFPLSYHEQMACLLKLDILCLLHDFNHDLSWYFFIFIIIWVPNLGSSKSINKGIGVSQVKMGFLQFLKVQLLLLGTFYRTELSFFVPKLWLAKIYGVLRKYRDLTIRKKCRIFQIKNYIWTKM